MFKAFIPVSVDARKDTLYRSACWGFATVMESTHEKALAFCCVQPPTWVAGCKTFFCRDLAVSMPKFEKRSICMYLYAVLLRLLRLLPGIIENLHICTLHRSAVYVRCFQPSHHNWQAGPDHG